MKFTQILVASMILVLTVGCCDCKKASKSATPFKGTKWFMTQFEGRSFESKDNYFLVFSAEGKINGKGDCNTLMGAYTEGDNGALKLNMLAGTMMFCPNQQVEDKYKKMLQEVDSYKIDGKMLVLFNKGELVAAFEAR